MEEAEDRLEEGRLSRAVGPDDAGDRAALDAEPNLVEDVDALHVPGDDSVQLEERHLPTQVGLENERVVRNLFERTLGDKPSLVHHRTPLTHPAPTRPLAAHEHEAP